MSFGRDFQINQPHYTRRSQATPALPLQVRLLLISVAFVAVLLGVLLAYFIF